MDGGTEQNPAYGTAQPFRYTGYALDRGRLTLILTLTGFRDDHKLNGESCRLYRYLDEQAFRFNERDGKDADPLLY